MSKDFKSIYVKDLDVSAEAYITELMIKNYLDWAISKNKATGYPNCAFWKKEIAANNDFFNHLKTKYISEISYIKNLLKSFSALSIIKYVKENKTQTFRYLEKPKQQTAVFNIWTTHCEIIKNLPKPKKQAEKTSVETTKVQDRPSQKTLLSGL